MTPRTSHEGGIAPKVLAAAANGVIDMIAQHGGDVDSIFGHAGIDTRELDSPFNELNLRQYCALFEEASAQTGNDNFGLRFGHRFAPRRLGAIGYVAIAAPTLAAGIRNLVRYFPAHQDDSVLTLECDEDVVWLHYQIVHPGITGRRQDAELSLGMFCNIFWHALGERWCPLEIHFEHGPPDGRGEHETRFGAPVRFGQRTNSIAFRRSDLDCTMRDNDPHLLSVIEPLLTHRRNMRGSPKDFVDTLRARIRLKLGQQSLSLRRLAEEFGMSPWALQRRLRDEGLVFHDLVRASRRDLALRYVRHSDMALTDVALALGYSEQSAFSRAFRAWTGMSPRRYRQHCRTSGVQAWE